MYLSEWKNHDDYIEADEHKNECFNTPATHTLKGEAVNAMER